MPRHRRVVEVEDPASADQEIDQVVEAIRFGMDSLKQLCKDIVPRCGRGSSDQKDVINRLDLRFRRLIKAELVYDESSRIVSKVVEELTNDDNDSDEASILRSCESIADLSGERVLLYEQQITDRCIESSHYYVDFQRSVESALAINPNEIPGSSFDVQSDEMDTDVDDDVEREVDVDEEDTEGTEVECDENHTEVVPTIDPITKAPLKDPTWNKFCKHIYGRSAIITLLSTNKKLRCPTMGCVNKRYLRESHLVDDPQLEINVAKLQKIKRRRRARKYY